MDDYEFIWTEDRDEWSARPLHYWSLRVRRNLHGEQRLAWGSHTSWYYVRQVVWEEDRLERDKPFEVYRGAGLIRHVANFATLDEAKAYVEQRERERG